jgi:predicted RNA-binding protein with PUA-like domain
MRYVAVQIGTLHLVLGPAGRKGDAGEEWDGVRNYQARNFMREMAVGDLGFFYHSQSEKAVVGIVEVIAEAHPDSTTDDDRWECVDIKAVEADAPPVTLDRSRRGRNCPTWSW